jgi:outer membrane protein
VALWRRKTALCIGGKFAHWTLAAIIYKGFIHIFMKRVLYILFIGLLFAASGAAAQTPSPTPTPGTVAIPGVTPTPLPTPNPAATPSTVNLPAGTLPENLPTVPAVAPNFESKIGSLPELGRVGVDLADQRSMTLSEAIEAALSNNKDIDITRKNIRIAEFDLKSARGVYEPRFTGQSYYEKATVPNVSFFTPSITKVTNDSIVANGGLQAYLPNFGTVFNASVNNTRLESTNPISIISPQLTSNFTASITQPLFRGRSFDLNRRTIEIAKRNLSLSDVQFRQRTIDIVASVQRAYWDLTFALRNLQVQRDAVRDARAQLEHNQRLVQEGQLAPIDVVATETQVANFEQSVYDALNTVNQAENVLKNLISPNRNDAIWNFAITPVESVELAVPTTTLPEAVDLAIQNRPELEINRVQQDINKVDQRYYRELKKPQIDLVASYTSAGIGGSLNPAFTNPLAASCTTNPSAPQCNPGTVLASVGGAGTAFTDILANKYPTYRAGLQFNLPLFGDKTARAQYGRSVVEGERLEDQREQVEQTIQVDVRNALQSVRTAEARLRAAAIARENSERQYESERRKLDEGQSDIYRVLDRQTALSTARSAELRSRTELNKAISDLQRATGNTLKENNIETKK